jgi:hypothetical protein
MLVPQFKKYRLGLTGIGSAVWGIRLGILVADFYLGINQNYL